MERSFLVITIGETAVEMRYSDVRTLFNIDNPYNYADNGNAIIKDGKEYYLDYPIYLRDK